MNDIWEKLKGLWCAFYKHDWESIGQFVSTNGDCHRSRCRRCTVLIETAGLSNPHEGLCMFYGKAATSHYGLIPQHGNQCALITNALAPCVMEMQDQPPRWSKCSRVPDAVGIMDKVPTVGYHPESRDHVFRLMQLVHIQKLLERPKI